MAEHTPESFTDATVFREQTVMRDAAALAADVSSAPASTSDQRMPRVLKRRFVLEELIGSGGMGSVYRAKDLRKVEARDNRPFIAVKVLNNDFRQHPEAFVALEREASKSQGLRHSNIVSIFDFDKDEDVPFITMELLEGQELADLLRAYPNGLPEEMAWRIIEGMVQGLAHAHEESVVHADFKPGNIFVTERQSKILDFGIARAMRMNSGGDDTDFDPARLAALTPAYASREMLNGDNPEPRDDLYSLGIVTYMVLTGHHPYGRLPANEAAQEGLRPVRVKTMSRRRWRILEKCLQLNRHNRPASAREVYDGLFGKPAWQSWGIAAACAAIAVGALAFTLQEQAQMDVVKEEVRQEALVDAQVARIGALLRKPQFDENWQRTLLTEAQALESLTATQPISGAVAEQIEAVYVEHLGALEDLQMAFSQLRIARRFGGMSRVEMLLKERLLGVFDQLSDAEVDAAWVVEAAGILDLSVEYFADSSRITAAAEALLARLQLGLANLIEAGELDVAVSAWARFRPYVFDAEAVLQTDALLNDAGQALRAQEQQAAAAALLASLQEQLDVSCLRLDVASISDRFGRLQKRYPPQAALLNDKVAQRISQCVTRLGAIDPARAESLHVSARRELEPLIELGVDGVDPCSMHYLVGNGRRSGRGGFCADQLDNAGDGPQLVVVPGNNPAERLAISKFEISRAQFNLFCTHTGACEPMQQPQLPATGVQVQTVESYARWLSRETGYTYRLPTLDEWSLASNSSADETLSCTSNGAVETARPPAPSAVTSGADNAMGLVNVMGNAAELVKDNGSYSVLKSASCGTLKQRLPETAVDQWTGFRLVRELS